MAAQSPACLACSELLPELALGILAGRERAQALAHLETCARCSAELERLSAVADSLLEVVPGADPPVGFEVRALARMRPERSRAHRAITLRRALAGVALAIAVGLGGVALGAHLSSSGGDQTSALIANLSASRGSGEVILYPGHPGWFVMLVDGITGTDEVRCVLSTDDGRQITVGSFWLDHGSGSWSKPLPVALDSLRGATLQSMDGKTLGTARLNT